MTAHARRHAVTAACSLSLAVALVLALPSPALAVTPDELLVLYNTGYRADENLNQVQDSLETALYYVLARGVPLPEPWFVLADDGGGGTVVVEVVRPADREQLWLGGLTPTAGGALPGMALAFVDVAGDPAGVEGGLLGIERLAARFTTLFGARTPIGELDFVTDGDPGTVPTDATVASILDQCRQKLDRPLPAFYPGVQPAEDYRTRLLYFVLTPGLPLRTSIDFGSASFGGAPTSLDTCLVWVNEVAEVLASISPLHFISNPAPGAHLGFRTSLRQHRDTPTAQHRMMMFAGRVDGFRMNEALRLVDAAEWAEAHLTREKLVQPEVVITANTSGGLTNYFSRFQEVLEPEFTLVRQPAPIDSWEIIHVSDGGRGYRNGHATEGLWEGEWLPLDFQVTDFDRSGMGRRASRYLPGSLALDRNSEPGGDFKANSHNLPLRDLRGRNPRFEQTNYTFDLPFLEGATVLFPTLREPYLSGFPGPPEYLIEFLDRGQDVGWAFHYTFGVDPVQTQLGLPHSTFQVGDPLYRLDGSQVADTRAPGIHDVQAPLDLGGQPGQALRFRWLTDTVATSEVTLTSAGGEVLRVADLRPKRLHEVDVLGLAPGTSYDWEILSVVTDASEAVTREESVTGLHVTLSDPVPSHSAPGPFDAGEIFTTPPLSATGGRGRVRLELEVQAGVSGSFDVLRSSNLRVRANVFHSGLSKLTATPSGLVGFDLAAQALRRLDITGSLPGPVTGELTSLLALEDIERLSGEVAFEVSAVAAGPFGLVYLAEAVSGRVLRVDPLGGSGAVWLDAADVMAVTGAGASTPRALAFDGAGNLILFDAESESLLVFDASGVGSTLLTGAELAAASGEAGVDGRALVVSGDVNGDAQLLLFDLSGTDFVHVVDVAGGVASDRAAANGGPALDVGVAAALMPDGSALYLADDVVDELNIFDPLGDFFGTWVNRADLDATGLAPDPATGVRVAGSHGTNMVYRVTGPGADEVLLLRADTTGFAYRMTMSTGFGGNRAGAGPRLVMETGDRFSFDVEWSGLPVVRRLLARPDPASGAAAVVNGREVINEDRTPWDPLTALDLDGTDNVRWRSSSAAGAFAITAVLVTPDPDFAHLLDTDGDGIFDRDEERRDPVTSRPEEADGDLYVNRSDLDSDGDGLSDADESGRSDPREPPVDTDGDGLPDFVDPDSDDDGIGDGIDPCPLDPLNDSDADGICDSDDNCPSVANPAQEDQDADGDGDGCDCAPADATNPLPVAVDDLLVQMTGLAWTAPADGLGSAVLGEVLSGEIGVLHAERGTVSATCLASDLAMPAYDDTRPLAGGGGDGFYYLVRGGGACGAGATLADSLGADRLLPTCP